MQVRLFAGTDPVTGRDVYLTASIPGTDKKAHKRAEDKLAEFRTQVNKQRSTPSSVKLGYAIEEWLRTSEHEDSTREGYLGGTVASMDHPEKAGLMRRRLARVPAPRSGFAGFRFPPEVIMVA
ncbi:MAG: hypothetical protein ACREQ5_13160, partial [Candidatus Dormibacteria bacterium]